MGGGISHNRPKSAKESPRASSEHEVSHKPGSLHEQTDPTSPVTPKQPYTPESELEKKVVATLRAMNKERLATGKGNKSVMNRVLLNFPKMQVTFTELHSLFLETDTDRSGSLEIEELYVLMKKLNPDITHEIVDQIFTEADVFTDGKINFKEFLTCLALGYLLKLIPDLQDGVNNKTITSVPAPSQATTTQQSEHSQAIKPDESQATKPDESQATKPDESQATKQAESGTSEISEKQVADAEKEVLETSSSTTPPEGEEIAKPEAKSDGALAAEVKEVVVPSEDKKEQSEESAKEAVKSRSSTKKSPRSQHVFTDAKGVRRVFELATELYLAFDSSCTGTITFHEMERVINSTTGESEMTQNTKAQRKRRNSLNGNKTAAPSVLSSGKKLETVGATGSSPMTDLLSRDRWKELDWDSDGFITYQEFLCTYVKWVASLGDTSILDSDDEE